MRDGFFYVVDVSLLRWLYTFINGVYQVNVKIPKKI